MIMEIFEEVWGKVEGTEYSLYSIKFKNGFEIAISDFGATLVKVQVPTRDGVPIEINFRQNTPEDYKKVGGYLGAVVGRIANRIANAEFSLEDSTHKLFVNNNNVHCLHGGKEGFNYKKWNLLDKSIDGDKAILTFNYISKDGEEGFPGTLNVKTIYEITPMKIAWTFEAETDKTTIINITNHAYWNLEGLDTTIDDHLITVDSNKFMPGDATLVPTGEIVDVASVGLSMKQPIQIKKLFESFGDVDNNFILNNYHSEVKNPRFAAELYSEKTGVKMTISTTEPCIQVYTGNFMQNLTALGKPLKKHSAICLETQKIPNAINMPEHRESVILRPDQKYFHKTEHVFRIE